MSCNYPMLRYEYKSKVTIFRWQSKDQEQDLLWRHPGSKVNKIPCGQCMGCRIAKSKSWANRLLCETLYHDECWYLTLTYDNDHVPYTEYTHYEWDDEGEVYEEEYRIQTQLKKKDLQDFWKRLRRKIEYEQGKDAPKIKYYVAGEYGERTDRCHYHAIVYGLHIPDLKPTGKKNHLGQPYSESKWLTDIWGKGFVTIGQVTWESCAYCARYVQKKIYGEAAKTEYEHKPPEFLCSSNGLGAAYFWDNYETIYDTDELILPSTNGKVKKSLPPKYFDLLYETIEPEKMEEIKRKRIRAAEESDKRLMQRTSLTYAEAMEQREETLKKRIELLRRDKI